MANNSSFMPGNSTKPSKPMSSRDSPENEGGEGVNYLVDIRRIFLLRCRLPRDSGHIKIIRTM
jgi:hypothetical protein